MSARLDNKAAVLSKNFKGHTVRPEAEGGEEGGDAGEPVPAREYRLTGISLTRKQFESLVGEKAASSFFNEPVGKSMEPAFTSFKTIWLDDVYKNGAAKFILGQVSGKSIDIESGVKYKNISVKVTGGSERGCAQMACTVQAMFPMNVITLHMEEFMGKEIRVSLRLGSLDESGKSEEDKQEDLVEAARVAEENATDVNSKKGGDEARLN